MTRPKRGRHSGGRRTGRRDRQALAGPPPSQIRAASGRRVWLPPAAARGAPAAATYLLTGLLGVSLASVLVSARAVLASVLDPAPETLVPALGLALLLAGATPWLVQARLERWLGRRRRGHDSSNGWLLLGWFCLVAAVAGLASSRMLLPLGRWNDGLQRGFLGPQLVHAGTEWLWAGLAVGLPAGLIVLTLAWHLHLSQQPGSGWTIGFHLGGLVLGLAVGSWAGQVLPGIRSATFVGLASPLPVLLAAMLAVWLAGSERALGEVPAAPEAASSAGPHTNAGLLIVLAMTGAFATAGFKVQAGDASASGWVLVLGVALAAGGLLSQVPGGRADGYRRELRALLLVISVTVPLALVGDQRGLTNLRAVCAVSTLLVSGMAGGLAVRSLTAQAAQTRRGLAAALSSVACGWVVGTGLMELPAAARGLRGGLLAGLVVGLLWVSFAIVRGPGSTALQPGRLGRWCAATASLLLAVLILAATPQFAGDDCQVLCPAGRGWCDRLLALRGHAQHVAVIGCDRPPTDAWLRRFDTFDYMDGEHGGEPVWPGLRRSRARYDLMAILPIHEHLAEHAEDWTLEFFARVREHLGGYGLAACLVPVDGCSARQLEVLAATWQAAFGPLARVAVAKRTPGHQPQCLLLLGAGGKWPRLDFSAVPDLRLAGSVDALLGPRGVGEAHSACSPRLPSAPDGPDAVRHLARLRGSVR